jgi:hypothetical protein
MSLQPRSYHVVAAAGCVVRPIPCHASPAVGHITTGNTVTISQTLQSRTTGDIWLKLQHTCGYILSSSAAVLEDYMPSPALEAGAGKDTFAMV